ncbi:Pseudouridine synthase (modular protein) [uncultured spirochete]|uniref:Pseudouridine synthase (Modular protein) n=1 Tax=uncultured spirochete TaxID=156406 RepID=A0A3P3XNH9_9SPIR|nr:Pseudouridine synthase (modular protein) [uncultured spirochete]
MSHFFGDIAAFAGTIFYKYNLINGGSFAPYPQFCYDTASMIPILLENDEIIVVDKPSGLAAQPGEGVHDDVVAVLERQLGYRPFPVHRLDKGTAGCMMLAKSRQAAGKWSRFITDRDVAKRYYAWVSGTPSEEKGVIDAVLDGNKGAQEARTLWNLKETWNLTLTGEGSSAGGRLLVAGSELISVSLLELELKTGRMHQIRRHLAGIGLPILGDDRHGDFSVNKALRRAGVKRLMLWARELVLPAQASLPGGASILASEPPHFAAFREFLMRSGTLRQPNLSQPTPRPRRSGRLGRAGPIESTK